LGAFNQVGNVQNFLLESIWLLADEPVKKAAADDSGGFGSLFSLSSPLLPMLMIGIVFYLMMMRPEQKRRKEMEQLLANIKKNDKILLGSGICGTVVNAAPKSVYVTIRVDDSTNTKMRVLRSAIARVGQPDETEADAKEAS
jgi:preprotein translocase subunit YajC